MKPLTAHTHVYRHKLEYPVERQLLARYVKPDAPVLDVGTGATGRSALLAQSSGGKVVSVELNLEALQEFAAVNNHHGLGLSAADLLHLPFANNTFSVVLIALHGLDYVLDAPQRWKSYQEVERVLMPGGVLIFNGFNPLGMLLSPTGLRSRGGLKARLRYASTARFVRSTLIDVNGLELHQGLPRAITKAVHGSTGLKFETMSNLSGSSQSRSLVTLLGTAPYYVFRK